MSFADIFYHLSLWKIDIKFWKDSDWLSILSETSENLKISIETVDDINNLKVQTAINTEKKFTKQFHEWTNFMNEQNIYLKKSL